MRPSRATSANRRRFIGFLPPVPRPEGGNQPGAPKREARTPARRPASPGRTLSLRADPRGGPSDMLPDHRLRQVAMAPALAPASARIPFVRNGAAHAAVR